MDSNAVKITNSYHSTSWSKQSITHPFRIVLYVCNMNAGDWANSLSFTAEIQDF